MSRFHHAQQDYERFDILLAELCTIGERIMKALQDLKDEVAQVKTVEASAVTLIQGLATKIQAAVDNGDDDALEELACELKTSSDALAAAVTANTPAAPAQTATTATDTSAATTSGQ